MTDFPFLLVLASTSPYRRMLLERLKLPFSVCAPEVDETPRPLEFPAEMVRRLAEAKARAGAAIMQRSLGSAAQKMLVIGSDQVADCGGHAIGKPGSFAAAQEQLNYLSGKSVTFRTGLSLFRPDANRCRTVRIDVVTHYRQLSSEEINAYLTAEQPFNCAGAVRSEDIGITLFDQIESDDPTALIGLPLIALARLLREEGVNPLLYAPSGR